MVKSSQGEIKLLVADDHTLIRDGLQKILTMDQGIKIVGEASEGEEAVKLTSETKPHVVLMDINMPGVNGIEASKRIKEEEPETAIIILTIHDDREYIMELLNTGVSGYLLKDISADDLLDVIKKVAAGETIIDQRMGGKLMEEWRSHSSSQELKGKLTERELEVLREIVKGENNKNIAEKLYISEKTVKNHTTNLFSKLEVNDRTQAVLYAIKHKLVDLE